MRFIQGFGDGLGAVLVINMFEDLLIRSLEVFLVFEGNLFWSRKGRREKDSEDFKNIFGEGVEKSLNLDLVVC